MHYENGSIVHPYTDGTKATGKPGAPKGNANRLKHGARGVLTLSRAVKGHGWAYRLAGAFRRELEAEVRAIHGKISLLQQASILTACRWETCLKIYERWLRKDGRTEKEQLDAIQAIAEMSEKRDRIIERLLGSKAAGSAADTSDPWNALQETTPDTEPQ